MEAAHALAPQPEQDLNIWALIEEYDDGCTPDELCERVFPLLTDDMVRTMLHRVIYTSRNQRQRREESELRQETRLERGTPRKANLRDATLNEWFAWKVHVPGKAPKSFGDFDLDDLDAVIGVRRTNADALITEADRLAVVRGMLAKSRKAQVVRELPYARVAEAMTGA